MVNKRLIKKSGIYFIGNLSSKIMSAILIPIYAFYINTEDLGMYDFSQTVMGVLSPIIILAIWEAVLKFVLSEDDTEKQRKIMSTSAIFSLVMNLVFIIIANIFNWFDVVGIRYFGLVITMILLHTLVQVWQYYARATSNNKLYVLAGIVSTIVNFVCILIFVVFLKYGLFGLLVSYNIGQLSIIIIIERKLKVLKKIKIYDFDYSLLKRMLIFSSPLVLNLISAWFISGFGRIIITLKLGNEANGLYSFANKFSLIITMIGSVITMAIIEEAILSTKAKQLDKNFNKTLQGLFMIFQTLALLGVPAIVIFYEVIAETEYYTSLIFAPWLLIYAVSNTMASNIGSVFQAIDKTKYQFTTTVLGGVITFAISWLFIDKIGISAVIIGQILGAIVMLVTRYILVNRFTEMKLNWTPILSMLLIFIFTIILTTNSHYLISVALEILIIFIICFKNKNQFIELFKRMKR
ncbi:lipopolysaccharide biosynthesis protein [Trichococcus shcherbakoviae]|uniref:Polysaccharide biosynthesis protein n=1 Tax=Trichococcus shcherbakoviae TaxID=2094020 RepID=A0A383TBE6_9LACT|nr:oligosaccharide flippase family protein [Trichococcus shcherbakoviae]SYZ77256.1 polysaccharide biosynthesis protein [Trichococcus shcherbakoviae]